MIEILKHAALFARKRKDKRTFYIGAIAIRADGVMVKSRNESTVVPCHAGHAEFRICGKITPGSTVYVGRSLSDGTLGLAKPCKQCQAILKCHKIKRVYYSISDSEYGCMDYTELGN